MLFKKTLLAVAALAFVGAASAARPATGSFQVLMKIISSCTVTAGAGSNIQLGAAAGVDASAAVGTTGSSSINVLCAKNTAYNIALKSTNNASTAGLGTLIGTGANTDTLTYQLYSDGGYAHAWGSNGVTSSSAGSNTAGETGFTSTGVAKAYTVYAKATVATPALVTPDSYSDTVTVSVYY